MVAKMKKAKRGRPTMYTDELAQEICERLAAGESLRSICRDERMPDEKAVRNWARNEEHPFSPQYARARDTGYHTMADDIIEIADDGTNDWMERQNKNGSKSTVFDAEHVQRSRLRVEARKWLLSKMLPKVYGDKVVHQGEAGATFVIQGVAEAKSDEDWLEKHTPPTLQ